MSPPRRSRRRLAPFTTALIGSALILFLLIGGIVFIGQGSGPYRSSVDRSFAQQANALVGQSNAAGASFRSLMSTMPSLPRARLQQYLDAWQPPQLLPGSTADPAPVILPHSAELPQSP